MPLLNNTSPGVRLVLAIIAMLIPGLSAVPTWIGVGFVGY